MKQWAIVLLILVAVGVIAGLLIGGNVTQAERLRLLAVGCGGLAIASAVAIFWYNREG